MSLLRLTCRTFIPTHHSTQLLTFIPPGRFLFCILLIAVSIPGQLQDPLSTARRPLLILQLQLPLLLRRLLLPLLLLLPTPPLLPLNLPLPALLPRPKSRLHLRMGQGSLGFPSGSLCGHLLSRIQHPTRSQIHTDPQDPVVHPPSIPSHSSGIGLTRHVHRSDRGQRERAHPVFERQIVFAFAEVLGKADRPLDILPPWPTSHPAVILSDSHDFVSLHVLLPPSHLISHCF